MQTHGVWTQRARVLGRSAFKARLGTCWPQACVWLFPPSLAPLPGLHRVGGSSPRGWGALGQLSEATESSGGFLIYL